MVDHHCIVSEDGGWARVGYPVSGSRNPVSRKVVRMMVREEEKEFVFKDWLSEGVEGIRARYRRRFLPEEFHQHIREARKEMLLAVRSLFDAAIESIEKKPEKKATKIRIE